MSPEKRKHITSTEEMEQLAVSIASIRRFPKGANQALNDFLFDVYSTERASMLGVSMRRVSIPRPTLDFTVVWSTPLDLTSNEEDDKIEVLGEKHYQFSHMLSQGNAPFDSAIHVVDPRPFPTLKALSTYCRSQWELGQLSSRLIRCVELKR